MVYALTNTARKYHKIADKTNSEENKREGTQKETTDTVKHKMIPILSAP